MIITIETTFDLPLTRPISITPIIEWDPDLLMDQGAHTFFTEFLWPALEARYKAIAESILKVMDESRKVGEEIKKEREAKEVLNS